MRGIEPGRVVSGNDGRLRVSDDREGGLSHTDILRFMSCILPLWPMALSVSNKLVMAVRGAMGWRVKAQWRWVRVVDSRRGGVSCRRWMLSRSRG